MEMEGGREVGIELSADCGSWRNSNHRHTTKKCLKLLQAHNTSLPGISYSASNHKLLKKMKRSPHTTAVDSQLNTDHVTESCDRVM